MNLNQAILEASIKDLVRSIPGAPAEVQPGVVKRVQRMARLRDCPDGVFHHWLGRLRVEDPPMRWQEKLDAAASAYTDATTAATISEPSGDRTVRIHGEMYGVPPQLEQLRSGQGFKRLIMDSPGGSLTTAIEIIDRYGLEIDEVEIIHAASAGAIVACMMPGLRLMRRDAMVMLHPPSDLAMGLAADLRAAAQTLEHDTGRLIRMFTQRTGRDAEEVEAWFSGPDVWFTAEQCLERGLVDKILS